MKEAAPVQYNDLRIWSSDLDEASRFLRTIGSKNVGLMQSLKVLCQDHLVPIDDIPDWLANNADILHELKHIVIRYQLDEYTKLDASEPVEFLEKVVNTLFDNPLWASHRMDCKGFDSLLRESRWRSCAILLVKK